MLDIPSEITFYSSAPKYGSDPPTISGDMVFTRKLQANGIHTKNNIHVPLPLWWGGDIILSLSECKTLTFSPDTALDAIHHLQSK